MNPAPPPGHNPFEPPPVGSYGGASAGAPTTTTASEAVAALVCGVMAWSCFPLGIVAIWLGVRARKAVRESSGRMGGDGMALAGMITGGLFLGFWLLYFGAVAVGIVIGILKH